MAEIGTPLGSSHSGAIDGHCDAGVVNRALGWAAGWSASGVQSLPFQWAGWAGGGGYVGEDRVAVERGDRVGVGLLAGARGHAEEPGLGVDGVEPAVVAEL